MDAHILFRSDTILVTPAIARFGPVAYQIATITSVAVSHRQRLNPFAVVLVLAAAGLATFAFLAREQQPDYSLWAVIAAPIALILGVGWQRFRPVVEYQLVMKTAGHETETLTSFDREQVLMLREAIESAFHLRRLQVEQGGIARMQPSEPSDLRADRREREEAGLHITRDWVVANPDER